MHVKHNHLRIDQHHQYMKSCCTYTGYCHATSRCTYMLTPAVATQYQAVLTLVITIMSCSTYTSHSYAISSCTNKGHSYTTSRCTYTGHSYATSCFTNTGYCGITSHCTYTGYEVHSSHRLAVTCEPSALCPLEVAQCTPPWNVCIWHTQQTQLFQRLLYRWPANIRLPGRTHKGFNNNCSDRNCTAGNCH